MADQRRAELLAVDAPMEDIFPPDESIRRGPAGANRTYTTYVRTTFGLVTPILQPNPLRSQQQLVAAADTDATLARALRASYMLIGRPRKQVGGFRYEVNDETGDKTAHYTIITRAKMSWHPFALLVMLLGWICLAGVGYCSYCVYMTDTKACKDGLISSCVFAVVMSIVACCMSATAPDLADVTQTPQPISHLQAQVDNLRQSSLAMQIHATRTHRETRTSSGSSRNSQQVTVVDSDWVLPVPLTDVQDRTPDIMPLLDPLEHLKGELSANVRSVLEQAARRNTLVYVFFDIVPQVTEQQSATALQSWHAQAIERESSSTYYRRSTTTLDVKFESFLPASEYSRVRLYHYGPEAPQGNWLRTKTAFYVAALLHLGWFHRMLLDTTVLRIRIPVVKDVKVDVRAIPPTGDDNYYPLPTLPL